MLNYYILDTETTGLSASAHEIIQISIIRCEDRFQKTVNIKADFPNRASKQALDIQGKTYADLKKGMPRPDALEEIHSFIEEDGKSPEHRCIVCHNANFDSRFLHEMWRSAGKRFPADLWMCSIALSRKFAKKQGIVKPKLNLQAAMKMLGLEPKYGAHNAAIDSLNTYTLWEKLMSENLGHVSIIKNIPHVAKKDTASEVDMSVFDD